MRKFWRLPDIHGKLQATAACQRLQHMQQILREETPTARELCFRVVPIQDANLSRSYFIFFNLFKHCAFWVPFSVTLCRTNVCENNMTPPPKFYMLAVYASMSPVTCNRGTFTPQSRGIGITYFFKVCGVCRR